MVGRIYLDSMLDEGGSCAATEMGGFALDKGPEVSLAPEPFWKSISTSLELVRADVKQSVLGIFSLLVP